MRNINIKISAALNTDNFFEFSSEEYHTSQGSYDVSNIYQFISCTINYSISNSSDRGVMILSANVPISNKYILRSGQYIEIKDNGYTIFQGFILNVVASLDIRGNLLTLQICPSIFQLTKQPFIFDNTQIDQIKSILGIDLSKMLITNIAQSVNFKDLLTYLSSNTIYSNFFKKTIYATSDAPAQVFLIASSGMSRDLVFRGSIDYTNLVFYQREDGQIIIRLLTTDSSYNCNFSIDTLNGSTIKDNHSPIAAVLEWRLIDNVADTYTIVNNYSILPPNLANASKINNFLVTGTANNKYYPRLYNLAQTGWFSGLIESCSINKNILSNTATLALLNKYKTLKNQYLTITSNNNITQDWVASYQELLTAKEMAIELSDYTRLEAVITPDDDNLKGINTRELLGKIINIYNCDMKSGIIASYTRSYDLKAGSKIILNIMPLGSITAAWGS